MVRGMVGISSWGLANGLAGGQGLGRIMIEKLMTGRSREGMWIEFYEWE